MEWQRLPETAGTAKKPAAIANRAPRTRADAALQAPELFFSGKFSTDAYKQIWGCEKPWRHPCEWETTTEDWDKMEDLLKNQIIREWYVNLAVNLAVKLILYIDMKRASQGSSKA